MSGVKLEEVFKVGGVPTHTFVEPVEYNQLIVALRTPGRGIVVEGPSGIGKTTALMRAIDKLCIKEDVINLSGRRTQDIDLIKELPNMGDVGIVLIDDFHRLDNKIKQDIADHLKLLADEESTGSKIIVLGINQAGQTLIKFAQDLNNRLEVISFEKNPDEKVRELLNKGQDALKININIIDDIVSESNGSFYIAQMLASQICIDANILESSQEIQSVEVSFEFSRGKVFDRLSRSFKDCATAFCQGTRVRPEGRAPYLHLLYWLAQSDDWTVSIKHILRQHPEHRGSIIQVAEKGYLASLINTNPEISSVLHYDSVSQLLTVEDPQFMYYIKNLSWNKFAKDIGFDSIGFTTPYDFALSFAGEDREIAKMLFDKFEERETHVFYDKNEQHRILAQDVEDYLRPIYQSDAEFVVVLLSLSYPKKIWCKFESDNFKQRFKEKSVIPIWFDEVQPGLFDETTRVGGISFVRSINIENQLDSIVDLCCKKLQEFRNERN
ncbi:TIR domain-containing protein [Methylovulum psychrotolerans]|uniref:AAA+ ATPase domain-containing protein n=1 Tax=Methylovulum psychrotolerans TaxID=1704499 RepID=A0A2S5CM96_9GAMM|nr:TIR domain-containing protein [Methylovulum psychrotolerans]POZ51940.1 hypothetical protein AADEFJLK_02160 [Methylovulum psychrotolerans]